ncbi:hypothetical protein [Nocardioides sp. P5_C9_2]
MLAATGASEPPTITSPSHLTTSASAADRRAPRRARTRVVVGVAGAMVVLSTVFTWVGAGS